MGWNVKAWVHVGFGVALHSECGRGPRVQSFWAILWWTYSKTKHIINTLPTPLSPGQIISYLMNHVQLSSGCAHTYGTTPLDWWTWVHHTQHIVHFSGRMMLLVVLIWVIHHYKLEFCSSQPLLVANSTTYCRPMKSLNLTCICWCGCKQSIWTHTITVFFADRYFSFHELFPIHIAAFMSALYVIFILKSIPLVINARVSVYSASDLKLE